MAKKRKAKKSTRTYRRRGIGAAGSGMVMEVAGVTAGALLAKQVGKLLPNLNSTLKSAITVAVGVALPKFVKSPIMNAVGSGMVAVGGADLVTGFVPSLGAEDDVVLISGTDISEMNGLDEIGGAGEISELNGIDEQY